MSPYIDQIYEKDIRCSDWFKQGWVFQKRMLAPRLLTFTRSQVLWGCSELQAAETWPCGKRARTTSIGLSRSQLRRLGCPTSSTNSEE